MKRLISLGTGIMIMILLISCSGNISAATSQEPKMVALKNFLLIDGTGARPVSGRIVLIKGDRILSVGDEKSIKIPKDCQKIDLKGCTLMPGFINAHVHGAYDEQKLQEWASAGVTTVRDLSPHSLSNYLKLRDEYNKKPENARIVSANRILTAPEGYGSLYAGSPEEARKIVNELIDSGVDVIKMALEDDLQGRTFPLLDAESAKAIVDTAHKRNKRVVVHISHERNLQTAIDAGVDELGHMVVEPIGDDTLKTIIKKGIIIIPTLELWQGVSSMYGLDWEETAAENLGKFYKAGGKIVFGTDYAGYTTEFDKKFPITEAKLMQKAGVSNGDIIVSGTKNAAIACGLGKELGTVEAGKLADLLVVQGNPDKDINTLTQTKMVVHKGKIIVNKLGDKQGTSSKN